MSLLQQFATAFTPAFSIPCPHSFYVSVSKHSFISCCSSQSQTTLFNGTFDNQIAERDEIPSACLAKEAWLPTLSIHSRTICRCSASSVLGQMIKGFCEVQIKPELKHAISSSKAGMQFIQMKFHEEFNNLGTLICFNRSIYLYFIAH
ncbi:hypothetical protein V6N11_017512 [Hibiscus sabdariffa]|uniref:Uncharacterized protein n=1 Tax=Hibiscus sabdariffa TaxID=183260 RepID=A0ABR2TY78_9ROSI